jgi:hypothetical protein
LGPHHRSLRICPNLMPARVPPWRAVPLEQMGVADRLTNAPRPGVVPARRGRRIAVLLELRCKHNYSTHGQGGVARTPLRCTGVAGL